MCSVNKTLEEFSVPGIDPQLVGHNFHGSVVRAIFSHANNKIAEKKRLASNFRGMNARKTGQRSGKRVPRIMQDGEM